jgi:hypothetical protein
VSFVIWPIADRLLSVAYYATILAGHSAPRARYPPLTGLVFFLRRTRLKSSLTLTLRSSPTLSLFLFFLFLIVRRTTHAYEQHEARSDPTVKQ